MKLIDWIKKQGVTQTEVAESLGMDKGRLSRILHGNELPTLFQAKDVFDLTGGKVMFADWFDKGKK